MKEKRVLLFCGHYGSGKTNLAVNFALHLAACGGKVSIADLDIVNPYFRTKDSAEELEKAGVPVISPQFANTNVDLPALPASVYGLVQDRSRRAVFDIGGDDRGALALGRFAPSILEENSFQMIYVANFYRPLTRTFSACIEVMREIEAACGIPFTALVNNSNIGAETSAEDVLQTKEEAEKLSEKTGLPLLFTSAEEKVASALSSKGENVFPLRLQKKIF